MSRPISAHAVSDPQLRRWFLEFKRKYFPSLAENTAVFWEPCEGSSGKSHRDDHGDFTIRVDPCVRYSQWVSRIVLLHEMAHCVIWTERASDHGRRFQQEIDRLYQAGAYRKLL